MSILIDDFPLDFAKAIIQAWLGRDTITRRIFYFVFALIPIAITIGILSDTEIIPKSPWNTIVLIIAIIILLLILFIIAIQFIRNEREAKARILEKEEELRKHPESTKTAWELARLTLESYLRRNIKQVSWIFFWTILIMIAGFIIIGYGIFKVYESPDNFKPSILVSISGILTELVSATFLVIYRSTMTQAKEYVKVLERINAVGMSVQILETIDDKESDLKNKTKAELASVLLNVYGQIKN